MTTPDPDRKSAPFEWRALTINKVEKIQLARLHEEQDRIEKELREQEALERAARQLEAREREGEAVEQAWFDAGSPPPRAAADEHDTQKETAAFTPLKRLSYSLAAFGRRLMEPRPKPRSSVPPPPLNESPISLSLVLAACAFGGSVYLSLRWVAEVRQANVTQQLSSSINATTSFTNAGARAPVLAMPTPPVAAAPRASTVAAPLTTTAAPTSVTQAPSQPPSALGLAPQAEATAVAIEPVPPSGRAFVPARAISPAALPSATSPAVAQPTVAPPPPPRDVAHVPELEAPASGSPQAVRARPPVPAAGSPQSSGPRVYRADQ